MTRVHAAIFDMDGLMVDTEPLYFEAESELARRFDKTFTREVMHHMMGHKATRSIQIMMEILGIEGSISEILTLRDMLYESLLVRGINVMRGLLDLLDWLETHGYRKAVATSSRRRFKDIIFDQLDLHGRFEVVITGGEVSEGKPSPEIYQRALHDLGLLAEQCVVLEDSGVGLTAAKRAGCPCIVVPNEFTENQDFSTADLVVPHLFHKDIRRFFEEG
jgi:HAD superfamily hydrolase (TIGR01509 family)